MQITKEYLEKNNACKESYAWLEKQKKRDAITIANKLYKEEKYGWCFWLLYRTTTSAKVYLWGLILLSFLMSGISFYLTLNYKNNVAVVVVAVAAVAAAVAVVVVAVAAVAADFFIKLGCKIGIRTMERNGG